MALLLPFHRARQIFPEEDLIFAILENFPSAHGGSFISGGVLDSHGASHLPLLDDCPNLLGRLVPNVREASLSFNFDREFVFFHVLLLALLEQLQKDQGQKDGQDRVNEDQLSLSPA